MEKLICSHYWFTTAHSPFAITLQRSCYRLKFCPLHHKVTQSLQNTQETFMIHLAATKLKPMLVS